MKTAINLVTAEQSTSDNVGKIRKLLNRISTILIVLFLILGGSAGIYLIILTGNINASRNRTSQIVNAISDMENTEQEYVLVSDRLDKIRPKITEKSADKNISVVAEIADFFPASVEIVESQIESESVKINFKTASSLDLVILLSLIESSDKFDQVELDDFSFTSQMGYLGTFKMVTK